MPENLSISFEEATGQVPEPKVTKQQQKAGATGPEISFEEATGNLQPPTGDTSKSKVQSFVDKYKEYVDLDNLLGTGFTGAVEDFAEGLQKLILDPPSPRSKEITAKTDEFFLKKVPDSLADAWLRITGQEVGPNATFDQKVEQRTNTALGAGKAIVGGLADMGQAAKTGVAFLTKAAMGKVTNEKEARQAFAESEEFGPTVRKVVETITFVNLSPENKEEQAMEDLVRLVPESIYVVGEDIYQRTGSIALAAGTEGFGFLLTLKPSIVTKALKGKNTVEFQKIAAEDPALAQQTVQHVAKVDVKTAAKLQEQIDKVQEMPPEQRAALGEKAVKAEFEKVGETPQGKPRVRVKKEEAAKPVEITPEEAAKTKEITQEQVSDGMAKSSTELYKAMEEPKPKAVEEIKAAKTPEELAARAEEAAVDQAFPRPPTVIAKSGVEVPGADFVVGKLKAYYEEALRLVNPEGLGPEAKTAAAQTAKNIAAQMQKDVWFHTKAADRLKFWEGKMKRVEEFINNFEQGRPQRNKTLQKIDQFYRDWNRLLYESEQRAGIKYEPVDNYLYHAFQDSGALAAWMEGKYGPRWAEPGFVKDRAIDLYKEAKAAGLKPKFKTPEEIMLARQHASDVAKMRIDTLKDLETYGVARAITKDKPNAPTDWVGAVRWRSPNGTSYWVHNKAAAVLHNAFETRSLWTMPGIRGDVFRGAMFLKNTLASALLAVSGFHALHVLTLDNATTMVRATKELSAGKKNPIKWMAEVVQAELYGDKGIPFLSLYTNPAYGGKLMRVYEGKAPISSLSMADRTMLQYMQEGGMVPHMSAQYKTAAYESFRKAVRDRSVTAAWKFPFAVLNLLQKPMMEVWIPRLKLASYAKDVKTALKVDPTLLVDNGRRAETFRRLAKSVDNRYGEMAYSTLFWNRMLKDLGVANTLSLGWQLGFIREYGGGLIDIGQFAKPGSSIQAKIKAGKLDRPMFVSFYTTQALLYGGLMTWALTGEQPQTLEDYVYPKNGEKNPDGTDQRVNTMYYAKEFASISKRMEIDGVAAGLKHVIESKASGVVGLTAEWATGLNSMGQEIRDPNSPAFKQLEQSLAYTLQRLEPISIKSVRESDRSVKSTLMGISGFSPVPKYVKETVTQGKIKSFYQKYSAPSSTPYEKFLLSKDKKELERLYTAGDMEGYDKKFDDIVEKFDLTDKEQMKLTERIGEASESPDQAFITMFQRLPWQKQKVLLDQMSEEERAVYLPVSDKNHLRFEYEPPEEKSK